MGEDNEWDEKKIIIIKKNRLPQPHMGRKAGPDNMHNTACLLLIDSQQQVSAGALVHDENKYFY